MFRTTVGPLFILSLFSGACGGSVTEPTRTTTSARVSIVNPPAGTTLARGTPFRISFTVEYAQNAYTMYTVAFVRDDGLYSPPLTCGGGGSSGGAFADQPVEIVGAVGTEWKGNILYQFAKGHRVNAVLLLKRAPSLPSGPASDSDCDPIAFGGRDPSRPTQGAVFPANADQRVDMSLNWLIPE